MNQVTVLHFQLFAFKLAHIFKQVPSTMRVSKKLISNFFFNGKLISRKITHNQY